MSLVKHPALKWVLLAGIVLALAVLVLSSRVAAAECGGPIRMGEQKAGAIERSGTSCDYEFKGEKGQEVAITLVGVTLEEPLLELYGPGSRAPLDEKDCANPAQANARTRATPVPAPRPARNAAAAPEARIKCYLPRDGTYRIVPKARTASGTGQYVLNFCGTYIEQPYDVSLKWELANETIQVGGLACYSFPAQAGDCVTTAMNRVSSKTSTLDPWLDLRDPAGTIVASDDESNGDGDALIRDFCLKKPGLYTIIARSYDARGAGPFTFYFGLQEAPRRNK